MRPASDLKAGLVFLAIGIWACVEGNRLGFGSVHAPEPGFFPWLGGLVLSGLSLGLFCKAWRGQHSESAGIAQTGTWIRPAILTGALILYVPLLGALGYPIATTALCVAALRVLGVRRWPVTLSVSVVLAAGSFIVFKQVLGVELPAGVLTFLG